MGGLINLLLTRFDDWQQSLIFAVADNAGVKSVLLVALDHIDKLKWEPFCVLETSMRAEKASLK